MTSQNECNPHVYCLAWDVGYHPSFSANIYNVLKLAISHGCYAVQFFLGNPQAFNRHIVSFDDIRKSKKLLKHFPMHVFSHFPYIANLAGSVKQLAWHGNMGQDAKTGKVLKSLQYELSVLSNFDGRRNGVVIHPGAYPDRAAGLANIARSINKIEFVENSKLLLENAAGQGNALATTFEEIKTIIDGVEEKKREHVGVCVDTAHIWGVGNYDLSKVSEIDRMFADFDRIIGIERFTLLHLNDSKVKRGSRIDRHACLGSGYIWGDSFDSLIHLLNTCRRYGIPAILETHGMDMITLSCLQ